MDLSSGQVATTRGQVRRMWELTNADRKQLENMIEEQRVEQDKKRHHYIRYKAAMGTSRYHRDANQRLGKLETRHMKSQKRALKNSRIKRVELTEQEKEDLVAFMWALYLPEVAEIGGLWVRLTKKPE